MQPYSWSELSESHFKNEKKKARITTFVFIKIRIQVLNPNFSSWHFDGKCEQLFLADILMENAKLECQFFYLNV